MNADIKVKVESIDKKELFEVSDEFKGEIDWTINTIDSCLVDWEETLIFFLIELGFQNTANYVIISAWGYRHQQSLILFFTLTIAYSMRACMGVALVAMTHHDFQPTTNNITLSGDNISNFSGFDNQTLGVNTSDSETHVQGFFNALMLMPPYPSFKWSKKVQDTVISSFLWGYMSLQVPAGQLAHKFGARYLLTGAMTINCLVSALLPIAAYYGGWIFTVILRVLQGASQACIMPGMHTFFGKWAPLEERGRLTSLTYGGQAFGTVLGLPITGFVSSSALGWPGIFRFYAVLSGIIAAVVWWFARDTPAKHPKISAGEKRYIEEGLGQKDGHEKRHLPVPWSKIFKSKGVYAIIVAHIGSTWGQLILYSEVPAFMDNVMGVNIKANGLLTALPFLVMWFANFFVSWFTDMLIVKKVLSVTNVRKLANSMGCIPPAIGLVVLGFVPKNIYVVETILVLICTFKISANMGFQVNHIDMSPNFAGTLMSLSNFLSNAVASLAPIIAGFILTDVKSDYLWRYVFFMAAGVYFFTNLFYCIFGTAERAEWNESEETVEANPEEKAMLETNDKYKQ